MNRGVFAYVEKSASPTELIGYIHQAVQSGLRRAEALKTAVAERTREIQRKTEALQRELAERKQMEDLLRQSEARFRLAQETAGVGCWDWDTTTGSLWWSDQTYRLHGVEPGSFVPSFEAHLEHMPREDRTAYQKTVEEALLAGQPFEYELTLSPSEEAVRHCLVRGNVRAGENGKPLGMFGTVFDITERKLAEKNLQEATALLRTAMDCSKAGIAIADAPDGEIAVRERRRVGNSWEIS